MCDILSSLKMGYTCHFCTYSTTRKSNFERHLESHNDMAKTKDVYSNIPSFSENSQNNLTKIDLRLVPNFKLFVCGPSR